MKVILKPISHPQLGEITIADELFAVGRNEEPFASKLGEAATRLSRRHARIFQEEGKVYLADLGSLNGTSLNERPLKNGAAVLRSNDRITFGNEISFRVEIECDVTSTLDRAVQPRLTLVPVDASSGLESIAVERFPFLIARVDSAFEQYRDRFPDALRKLSRRHAVIALKGEQLYVEDLESSNGTYLAGQKLDERARPIADGDVLMFGSEQFAFKARIESQSQKTQLADPADIEHQKTMMASVGVPPVSANGAQPVRAVGMQQPVPPADAQPVSTGNRTRFVSSADSFINVFCAQGPDGEAAAAGKDVGETAEVQKITPPSGLQKLQAMAGQFWRAVGGPAKVNRKAAWAVMAVLGVAIAAVAGSYLIGSERREIKALLDEGRYDASARVANAYLKEHPEDHEAGVWAEEALTKAVVPAWMKYIEVGKFEDAERYLRTQDEAHQFIQRGRQLIDTLSWAGRVEAHMADRGGPAAPIVLFRHEAPIKALVTEWDADSFRRQQVMDQIVTREPGFEPIHSRVFSSLRTLRSDNLLYVKAITQFESAIRAALDKDDRPGIDKLIGEFASSYPRIGGLGPLKEDLQRYDALLQLAAGRELTQLARAGRATTFNTPVFADHVEGWLVRSLPPPEIIAKHEEAATAWRAGNHDDAITILRQLTDGPWGDVASQQIARYQKVEADYEALLAARGSEGYWDQLLLVWASLRPQEDEHLIRSLEPDFLAHRDKVAPRLDESLRRVRTYWNDYQGSGGIPGVVRVEDRVSEKFAGQARRLTSAYREISSGTRTYQLLQVAPPAEWESLAEQIVNEVQRQRRWLQDLNIVLEPALLQAKLNLLPEASEQSSWVRSTTDRGKD